jgi:putative two-component system response regulator
LLDQIGGRDAWERGHAERVAVYAVAAGERLGLSDARLLTLRYAAQLHDVGKLDWTSANPTAAEIRRHPADGATRLAKIPFLRRAAGFVGRHHERIDGSGYPSGLRDVPLEAQLIGAAEALDVLLHGAPWADATGDLSRLQSLPFDQEIVDALTAAQRVIQPLGS